MSFSGGFRIDCTGLHPDSFGIARDGIIHDRGDGGRRAEDIEISSGRGLPPARKQVTPGFPRLSARRRLSVPLPHIPVTKWLGRSGLSDSPTTAIRLQVRSNSDVRRRKLPNRLPLRHPDSRGKNSLLRFLPIAVISRRPVPSPTRYRRCLRGQSTGGPYRARRRRLLLGRAQLLMCSRSRMDHQAARITDIRQMRQQFECRSASAPHGRP